MLHCDFMNDISETEKGNKAPAGFEPANEGFAGLSLTTWVRRRAGENIEKTAKFVKPGELPRGKLFYHSFEP